MIVILYGLHYLHFVLCSFDEIFHAAHSSVITVKAILDVVGGEPSVVLEYSHPKLVSIHDRCFVRDNNVR